MEHSHGCASSRWLFSIRENTKEEVTGRWEDLISRSRLCLKNERSCKTDEITESFPSPKESRGNPRGQMQCLFTSAHPEKMSDELPWRCFPNIIQQHMNKCHCRGARSLSSWKDNGPALNHQLLFLCKSQDCLETAPHHA